MSRSPLTYTILAALLALLLTAAGCAPGSAPRDAADAALGKGAQRGARDVPVLATPGTLFSAGRESYERGHYAVAAKRFEALLKKTPNHPMGTAYLGLCRWFQGKPRAMETLWKAYPPDALPGFADTLRAESAALTLLAHRLRARGYAEAARRGNAQPLTLGLALATRPREISGLGSWDGLPSVNRALYLLMQKRLESLTAPRFLEYGLTQALAAETGLDAPSGATPEYAMALARLVGAEYAVSSRIGPAPGEPSQLRTIIAVAPTEPVADRRERLAKAAEEAAKAATEARQTLVALDQDIAVTAFGLKYFQAGDHLTELIAERTALEQRIIDLNRNGSLTAAKIAVGQLRKTEQDIAKAQTNLRELEQATLGLASHVFAYNKTSLSKRDAKLRATRAELMERMNELNAKSDKAYAAATRTWPPGGITASFDLARIDLGRWPARAAAAVADILQGTLPPSSAARPTTGDIVQLHRALTAWADGEYASAKAILPENAPLGGFLTEAPPADFDLLAQSAMRPEALAQYYSDRLQAARDEFNREVHQLLLPGQLAP